MWACRKSSAIAMGRQQLERLDSIHSTDIPGASRLYGVGVVVHTTVAVLQSLLQLVPDPAQLFFFVLQASLSL